MSETQRSAETQQAPPLSADTSLIANAINRETKLKKDREAVQAAQKKARAEKPGRGRTV